ncbi:hypothetical protein L3X38_009354 [Prunus dulcis]|uniref:Uncharacterized protein n=1 Tax=Prunus dulcis TaxID=3755 RepID=A0AAD4ZYX1_PRUDU|nr:hypothetical protein L3X38_009354 [Prunus dulcis]
MHHSLLLIRPLLKLSHQHLQKCSLAEAVTSTSRNHSQRPHQMTSFVLGQWQPHFDERYTADALATCIRQLMQDPYQSPRAGMATGRLGAGYGNTIPVPAPHPRPRPRPNPRFKLFGESPSPSPSGKCLPYPPQSPVFNKIFLVKIISQSKYLETFLVSTINPSSLKLENQS